MTIKTGQTVKILSGKDKGKTGKIIQVFPTLNKVVVDGVNKAYKHLKRRHISGSEKGERIEYFAPIHRSNVKEIEVEAVADAKKEKKSTKKEDKQQS